MSRPIALDMPPLVAVLLRDELAEMDQLIADGECTREQAIATMHRMMELACMAQCGIITDAQGLSLAVQFAKAQTGVSAGPN
jgi:hypothetical protein